MRAFVHLSPAQIKLFSGQGKQSNEVSANQIISSGRVSASQVLPHIILAGSQGVWIPVCWTPANKV